MRRGDQRGIPQGVSPVREPEEPGPDVLDTRGTRFRLEVQSAEAKDKGE